MADLKTLVEREMDRAGEPTFAFVDLVGLRVRRHRTKQVTAAAVGLGLVLVLALVGASLYRGAEVPANPPDERAVDLGIFEPLAGRIVYWSDGSLWGVDPNAPTPASTLVRLGAEGQFESFTVPLGWSSDGTKLLFVREDPADDSFPYDRFLSILHADGTETQVVPGPVEDAAISPDGSQVAFVTDGLYVVDAQGGEPVLIADEGNSPTFSPDGTQIAYLGNLRSARGITGGREEVWVANSDGTDAHEILADEPILNEGVFELEWSPAGDRIAMENSAENRVGIYTFTPDGSDFTEVITGGFNAHWSPDGTQIAYGVPGRDGLSIVDADGSNVRTLSVGGPGPWHPAQTVAADEVTPTPSGTFARANGEVLSFGGLVTFAGTPWDRTGDLGAVDPETGEERVLVADLDKVVSAEWSADGRWVAYERHDGNDVELWVVGMSQEPRLIATGGYLFADGSVGWTWSATGADLLWARRTGGSNTIDGSKLHLVDVETGETVVLGSVDGDVGGEPAWSPDGTRITFASGDGAISSIELESGTRSLLARIPGIDPGSEFGPTILWSPTGTHISVVHDLGDLGERLYVMDANGTNVRQLADSNDLLLVSWSPDGTRLAFTEGSQTELGARIFVAPIDGSDPVEIGSVPFAGCTYNYMCGLAWSPDGTRIGFHRDEGADSAIAADGSSEPEPIDDLTYMSWAGGRYGEG